MPRAISLVWPTRRIHASRCLAQTRYPGDVTVIRVLQADWSLSVAIGFGGAIKVNMETPRFEKVDYGPGPGKQGAPAGSSSQDHHFIPCFYSKRWALNGGKLCEFSRPYDAIKPRRTSPKGTGYVAGGYALQDVAADEVNRLEEQFYKPVDTRAADALALLETGIGNSGWPSGLREAWTRFVFSLLLRMPEDMAILEASYTRELALLTDEQERKYAARRMQNWPPTLAAALEALNVEEVSGQSKELATRLMQNSRISEKISALHWATINTSPAARTLLTSDRPVQLNGQLGEVRTTLILPIGPKRLFVAGRSNSIVEAIRQRGPDRLVSSSNQAVARAADRFVYSVDDSMLEFVQKNFRRARPKPLAQRLIEYVAAKRGSRS